MRLNVIVRGLVVAIGVFSVGFVCGEANSHFYEQPPPTSQVGMVTAPLGPSPHICGLPPDLREAHWPRELAGVSEGEERVSPGSSLTLAIIPDAQYYTGCRYAHLRNQCTWLSEVRAERNVLAAISLGDLTDHNSAQEWEFVRESVAPVKGILPFLVTTGNHDLGTNGAADNRKSLISDYFDESWASVGGVVASVMTAGQVDNAFYSINAGRFRLGVLMLEWSPRRSAVEWANRVLAQHSDHRVIVATHAYLYDDSTRYDYATRGDQQRWSPIEYLTARGEFADDGSHDGEMLWTSLVRKHPGIFLVLSGHVLGQGAGRLTSRGDAGNTVHQLLSNYQMLDEGGLGYLRLLEILPDGMTLLVKTYSPSLGKFSYAPSQQFRLKINPPLFVPATASTLVSQGMH